MQSYLINLDRAPERLARMRALLEARGVAFERVPAIDARAFTAEELALYRAQCLLPEAMAPGDIACGATHLSILRRIAEGEEEYGFVMEDDIHLAADIAALLGSTDWIPPDADLVKLETFRARTVVGGPWIRLANGRRLAKLRSLHAGGAAYIVSRAAARRIVGDFVAGAMLIDNYMFGERLGDLGVYQLYPAAAVQDFRTRASLGAHLESDINPQRAPAAGKPRGAAKFARECRRLGVAFADFCSRLAGRRVTGKVPYKP